MGKHRFERVSGAISCGLLGRGSPGRASCPCTPGVRGRGWPGGGEGEPSRSYADLVGLVPVRSLSRAYPERTLNHPVLYTAGHFVPPAYPVAFPRLYLVKMFILSSNSFLQRGASVTTALRMAEAVAVTETGRCA